MVDFPYAVHWTDVAFQLVGQAASAGFGLSGASINVASNSGHWVADVSFLIRTEDQYFGWQGFIAEMRGTVGTTVVPCRQRYLPFDGQARRMNGLGAVDFGGSSFPDTSGLGQSTTIHAELAAPASLRDGVISVRYLDTTGLRPGHYITIGENLHQVITAHETAPDVYAIQIEPLIRQAYPALERVVLDRPHCRMRMLEPGQGVIGASISRVDRFSVRFVEDVR